MQITRLGSSMIPGFFKKSLKVTICSLNFSVQMGDTRKQNTTQMVLNLTAILYASHTSLHHHVCYTPWLMLLVSPTQPQRDMLTSMGSVVESDRYSAPLSMAPLPTDWGDWVPEVDPCSAPERDVASISLEEEQTSHFLMIFTLFMT